MEGIAFEYIRGVYSPQEAIDNILLVLADNNREWAKQLSDLHDQEAAKAEQEYKENVS